MWKQALSILAFVLRWFLFLFFSLLLYGVFRGILLGLGESSHWSWVVGLGLLPFWLFFAAAFGVVPRSWLMRLGDGFGKRQGVDYRRHLENPDLAVAEELHGALPADLRELYGSERRLSRELVFGDDSEDDLMIAEFLPIDLPLKDELLALSSKETGIPIAIDEFDNVYLARPEESLEGRTPIYFVDHETSEPIATSWTVEDVVRGSMRDA